MHPFGRRFFRFPWRTGREVLRDVDEELRFHIDARARDLEGDGVPPIDARAQALREFGDVAATRVYCAGEGRRLERGNRWRCLAEDVRRDTALTFRMLAKQRGFTAVALLTLTLAIGGHTALFSLVNALLLQAPAVASPDRLVRVHMGETLTSYPNYVDVAGHTEVFSGVAIERREPVALQQDARSLTVTGATVSAGYFDVLGVRAARGRVFTSADRDPRLVVVSDRCWRTRLAEDPQAIGRVLALDGIPHQVIGIMPPAFRGLGPPLLAIDLWRPVDEASTAPELRDRAASRFELVARLAPTITRDQAAAAVAVVGAQLEGAYPGDNRGLAQSSVFGVAGFDAFRGSASLAVPLLAFVAVLGVISTFVLAVGCLNLSSMLLARMTARRQEMAVRLALGAGRSRLVRQLLTESLVLAAAGACGGALLASWAVSSLDAVVTGMDAAVPMQLDAAVDARALGYALAVSMCAALAFGIAPALSAPSVALGASLRAGSDGPLRWTRRRLVRALVVAQLAVCTILLVCSGLFFRSLDRARAVDPGFDPSSTLVANLYLNERQYDEPRGLALYDRVLERVRAIEGVSHASFAFVVPLTLSGREEFEIGIDRQASADSNGKARRVLANRISPGYFETVRVPLVAGRDFGKGDRAGAPEVAIINETMARRFWPGSDAIGRTIRLPELGPSRGASGEVAQVVGVVRDSKYATLGESPSPVVYLPLAQQFVRDVTLHVRVRGDEAVVAAQVRAELTRLDPLLTVELARLTDKVAFALIPARVASALTGGFGLLAAALAAIGLYGVAAFSVAQRLRELGIRRALGAQNSDIVRLVARQAFGMTATGLAIGLAIATPAGYAVQSLLVGVAPFDPLTITSVAVMMVLVTALATAVPTRRALRIDPMQTLRAE